MFQFGFSLFLMFSLLAECRNAQVKIKVHNCFGLNVKCSLVVCVLCIVYMHCYGLDTEFPAKAIPFSLSAPRTHPQGEREMCFKLKTQLLLKYFRFMQIPLKADSEPDKPSVINIWRQVAI